MKAGNWWIKKDLLTSGQDPKVELLTAEKQFPDEYLPKVFMTGDGHRIPPFGWTSRGPWDEFFRKLVKDNKICCHVETYSDAVTINSVPVNLKPVFGNGKVFGWEPEFYKTIQSILEQILQLVPDDTISKTSIHLLTREMWKVHDMGYLRKEGVQAMDIWDDVRATKKELLSKNELPKIDRFMIDYQNSAMQLRTDINNIIGNNIQKYVDRYPDHMHLITCGYTHITHNPLYKFIKPPSGTFGLVDQNNN